jgi:hypothetical protein
MKKSLIDHTALSDAVYSILIRLLTGTCAVLCRSFGGVLAHHRRTENGPFKSPLLFDCGVCAREPRLASSVLRLKCLTRATVRT